MSPVPIKQLQVDLDPKKENSEVRGKRRVLSRVLEGSWTSILKGRGMEFAGYRQYTYGDDASKIDWNASLRAKETLVRELEEYRAVNVFFLLDVNDSMLTTSQQKLKAEYAAELTYHFAKAVADIDDAVGYGLFTDTITRHQFPAVGDGAVMWLLQDLSRGENYGGKSDFKKVMLLLNGMLKERTLVIIVSDFLNLDAGWERFVQMFATRFDCIGIMVRDPIENELTTARLQAIVEDPRTHERMLIDTRQFAKRFTEEAQKERQYVQNVFTKSRAGFVALDLRQEPIGQLTSYFKRRMRIIQT